MVRGPAAQKPNPWDLDRDSTWAASVQRYDREKLEAPPCPDVLPGRRYRDGRTNGRAEEREYNVLSHKWRDPVKEESKSREHTVELLTHMDKAAVGYAAADRRVRF